MDIQTFASLGGKARAKKLSKKRRVEISKLGNIKRWGNKKSNDKIKTSSKGVL